MRRSGPSACGWRAAAFVAATLVPRLWVLCALSAAAIAACSSAKTGLVGKGGGCLLASDCAPGLVCIDEDEKGRICTDDLSRVTGEGPSAGEDAGYGEGGEGGDASSDGALGGDTGATGDGGVKTDAASDAESDAGADGSAADADAS